VAASPFARYFSSIAHLRRCHLIGEWLEQVIIAPVDDRDLHEDDRYKATMFKIAGAWLDIVDRLTVLRASVIGCPESPDTFSVEARQDHCTGERNG
jgi:hypothetical protein